jgi:hypothetical protein
MLFIKSLYNWLLNPTVDCVKFEFNTKTGLHHVTISNQDEFCRLYMNEYDAWTRQFRVYQFKRHLPTDVTYIQGLWPGNTIQYSHHLLHPNMTADELKTFRKRVIEEKQGMALGNTKSTSSAVDVPVYNAAQLPYSDYDVPQQQDTHNSPGFIMPLLLNAPELPYADLLPPQQQQTNYVPDFLIPDPSAAQLPLQEYSPDFMANGPTYEQQMPFMDLYPQPQAEYMPFTFDT